MVDGFLNSSPDSTYIKLKYTRNLRDTAPAIPALNATLLVEGDQNSLVPLYENGKGIYGNLLPLKTSEKYRLPITTSDGTKYQSDYIPFRLTPPIDSISWEQDTSEVRSFINTHDPHNNTIYYRWHYEETWQYSTYLTSNFDYVRGTLYLSASTVQKKRIFIGINDMTKMNYVPYYLPCHSIKDVATGFGVQDSARAYEYVEMPRHLFTFWYFDGAYHIAQNFCIDCREHGGTN